MTKMLIMGDASSSGVSVMNRAKAVQTALALTLDDPMGWHYEARPYSPSKDAARWAVFVRDEDGESLGYL